MKITYTVEKTLGDEDISDIIDTAIEGGIGYWACLLNDEDDWKKTEEELKAEKEAGKIEDIYYSTVIIRMMELGRPVRFQDAEDTEEGEIWELTKEKFIRGCQLYEKDRRRLDLNDGGFDAIEADCVIQYALFGDIIYG